MKSEAGGEIRYSIGQQVMTGSFVNFNPGLGFRKK